MWSYVQDLVIPEIEYNENEVDEDLAVRAELDHSALMNNGEMLFKEALEAGWDFP